MFISFVVACKPISGSYLSLTASTPLERVHLEAGDPFLPVGCPQTLSLPRDMDREGCIGLRLFPVHFRQGNEIIFRHEFIFITYIIVTDKHVQETRRLSYFLLFLALSNGR